MTLRSHIARLRRPSRRVRLAVGLGGSACFVALAIWSIRSAGLQFADVRPLPLVGLLILSPAPIVLSALEYQLTAQMLGVHPDARQAMGIALSGFAANHLPIPGGTVVRVGALHQGGVPVRRAVAATAWVGIIWLSVALITGGAGITFAGHPQLGLSMGGAGLVGLAIGWAGIRGLGCAGSQTFGAIVVLEGAFLGLAAARVLLSLHALGVAAEVHQAAAMSAAGALSVAIGIVPAGIGLLEGLFAVLASVVAIDSSIGFLSGALMRVSAMVAAAPMLPIVLRGGPRQRHLARRVEQTMPTGEGV